MRRNYVALCCAAALLLGCDNTSNKATNERLDTLLQQGVDGELTAKNQERFDKVMARDNSIAALNATFDASAITNPQTVALDSVLASTLEHNIEIGRAAQNINRADARRLNAIFGYLPQISASASYTTMQQDVIETDNQVFELGKAEYPVINMAVELRQPLFDLSRIYAIRISGTARSRAEIEYIATVQRVLYETMDTYLEAAKSQRRVDELGRQVRMLSVSISGERTLSDVGLRDETTLSSLTAERSKIQSEIAIERARLARALASLSTRAGVAVSSVQQASVPRGVMGAERRITKEAAVSAALERSPDVLAAAFGVVENDMNRVQAIAADFAPVVDAFAKMEIEDRQASRFGGGSVTQDTSFGVRLRLPIFNARGDGMRTLDANIDLREGVLKYRNVRRQLEANVELTLERMAQLSRSMSDLRQAVAAAARNTRSERALLNSGESTEIQLVSRQLLESQLRSQQQTQEFEYLRAWAKLQHLTGELSRDVTR